MNYLHTPLLWSVALISLLIGCGHDTTLQPLPGLPITVEPMSVELSAPADACQLHPLILRGEDALIGLVWLPERGPVEAVQPPPLNYLELMGEAELQVMYCPNNDEPSAGELLLSFENAGLLGVWMEDPS